MENTMVNCINIGTRKHSIILNARQAVMFQKFATGGKFEVFNSGDVRALVAKGLLKRSDRDDNGLQPPWSPTVVEITAKGRTAHQRMHRSLFGM